MTYRYCIRCGKLFESIMKSRKVACPNCRNDGGRIFRVRFGTYNEVHKDIKKYSNRGLMLTADKIIESYQKIIKKFKLGKELDKIIHDGKDYG